MTVFLILLSEIFVCRKNNY